MSWPLRPHFPLMLFSLAGSWAVHGWAFSDIMRGRLSFCCTPLRRPKAWFDSERRRRLGTNKNIYVLLFWGVSKIPSKAPPRSPESTPRAQKRSPRAIPNDSRVGQNSTKNKQISRNVRRVNRPGAIRASPVDVRAATGTGTTKINEIRHGSSLSAKSQTEVRFVAASFGPLGQNRP